MQPYRSYVVRKEPQTKIAYKKIPVSKVVPVEPSIEDVSFTLCYTIKEPFNGKAGEEKLTNYRPGNCQCPQAQTVYSVMKQLVKSGHQQSISRNLLKVGWCNL